MDHPLVEIGEDLVPQYTADEERALTANLERLLGDICLRGQVDAPLGIPLLRQLHAAIFAGVRDHAGRIRTASFGTEYLTFGPNRSVRRDDVERQLECAFRVATSCGRRLGDLEMPTDRRIEEAITLAAWLHAEVVRIHPFQDGNGRTARALMDMVLVRFGIVPIPIEACKNEYNAALNIYHAAPPEQRIPKSDGPIRTLVDLFIRIAAADC